MRATYLGLILLLTSYSLVAATKDADNEAAARQVMTEFMNTFNARDEIAWAATFNYPHIRFASEKVIIADQASDITDAMDFDKFAAGTGWHHSAWNHIELINQGKNKVQFKVSFSRYNKDDKLIATYDSLYIVTNMSGRWGIQARSSFAP